MKEENIQSRRAFLEKMTPLASGIFVAGSITQSLAQAPENTDVISVSGSIIKAPEIDEKKFIPVMVTPYNMNSRIDFDQVSRLVDFYLAAGAKGFFANCLSSEMYFMDDRERIALTQHVVKYINGRVPVVSTGSFGRKIKDKADFTKKIHDTGVDAVILISSHFAEKGDSDDIMMKNFERFFEHTGEIRLGTYECPSPYKRVISPEVFKFLVDNERLIYHKDTSEDIKQIEVKLDLLRGSQMELYNAHTASGLKALQMGAKGMSPISGNFYPEIHSWLCENADNQSKAADASWIQGEIAQMEPVISKYYPISSKYFLQKRGLSIEIISRSNKRALPIEQKLILNDVYKTFLGWCERLNINPVTL